MSTFAAVGFAIWLVALGTFLGFYFGAAWAHRRSTYAQLERHVARRRVVLAQLRVSLLADVGFEGPAGVAGVDCARLELEVLADAFGLEASQ